MLKKILFTSLLLFFLIIHFAGFSYGQESYFGIDGGFSKALGEGSKDWVIGFHVGLNGFVPLFLQNPHILVGGYYSYNRFTPDEVKLARNYEYVDFDISGGISIFEFVPSIRILINPSEEKNSIFFMQTGIGHFHYVKNVKIKGTYTGKDFWGNEYRYYTTENIKDSSDDIGISFGGGFTIRKEGKLRFEILPLYHIIFTEEESTQYLTLSIGFKFISR